MSGGGGGSFRSQQVLGQSTNFPHFRKNRKFMKVHNCSYMRHVNLVYNSSSLRYIIALLAHIWRQLEFERGITRWHLVETWFWMRLRICRKTDCGKTMLMIRYLGFLCGCFSSGFPARAVCTWGVQVLRYPDFFLGNGSR